MDANNIDPKMKSLCDFLDTQIEKLNVMSFEMQLSRMLEDAQIEIELEEN